MILLVGFIAWVICLPRIGTLASILFFAGPMVGSTIWPIATGLFWKKANAKGALWGMLLGSTFGLISYFYLGWYTSSLVGASVSMVTVLICTYFFPTNFDWKKLDEQAQ